MTSIEFMSVAKTRNGGLFLRLKNIKFNMNLTIHIVHIAFKVIIFKVKKVLAIKYKIL